MKELIGNEDIDRQALISAVEEFTCKHDTRQFDRSLKQYRELIPSKTPGSGQQYAFEVDLDKCTGCKACVTACHNENGLDEDETWREVGLVRGGTNEHPSIQHITTACHHCAEPGCMKGCPTKAYVKDKATGIVKHLDDQCFGCQYCILKCPYDVPKYSKKRGIVHKCDMCLGRLQTGEPPACARACPTGAIRITLVNVKEVKEKPYSFVSVPDAPASGYTYPTTRYKTTKAWPANSKAIDDCALQPQHPHLPLVFMLVFTQLSVGMFLAEIVLRKLFLQFSETNLFSIHAAVAILAGILAIASSIFHLGRPLYAFRAVLGLATSWLSREILAFGLFAGLAAVYALSFKNSWIAPFFPMLQGGSGEFIVYLVFGTGLAGVLCSVMVYRDTKRPFWDNHLTTLKFIMTMGILGFSVSLCTVVLYSFFDAAVPLSFIMLKLGKIYAAIICGGTLLKILIEASIFYFLKNDDRDSLKKTAILMARPLKKWTAWRFVCAVLGTGMVFMLVVLNSNVLQASVYTVIFSLLFLLALIAGELLERYLFFRAVVPLKMPGGKIGDSALRALSPI